MKTKGTTLKTAAGPMTRERLMQRCLAIIANGLSEEQKREFPLLSRDERTKIAARCVGAGTKKRQ